MPETANPQQLIPDNAASQQPNPPPVAADALGSTRTVETTPKALIGDVGDDELVSGQLKKLISEDSPVLQQARARSQQYAAGRGLQNSTMAAQAGEQAVISTATPIAAQDAATVSGRRSQNLSTANQFNLNEQQFGQQRQLIQDQTDASSRLQSEQGTINERLQRLAAADEITRLREQGVITRELQELSHTQEIARLREQGNVQERLQTLDQNFRALQADLDRGATLTLEDRRFQNNQTLLVSEYAQRAGLSSQEADQELERMNAAHLNTLAEIQAQADAQAGANTADMAKRLQAQYLAAVSDRMAAASAEIQMIYQTQGLKAADQQAAAVKANERMRSDLSQLAAYYQQSPMWDDNWGAGTPTGQQPGAAAPAPSSSLPPHLASLDAYMEERGWSNRSPVLMGIWERDYQSALNQWQQQSGAQP